MVVCLSIEVVKIVVLWAMKEIVISSSRDHNVFFSTTCDASKTSDSSNLVKFVAGGEDDESDFAVA